MSKLLLWTWCLVSTTLHPTLLTCMTWLVMFRKRWSSASSPLALQVHFWPQFGGIWRGKHLKVRRIEKCCDNFTGLPGTPEQKGEKVIFGAKDLRLPREHMLVMVMCLLPHKYEQEEHTLFNDLLRISSSRTKNDFKAWHSKVSKSKLWICDCDCDFGMGCDHVTPFSLHSVDRGGSHPIPN